LSHGSKGSNASNSSGSHGSKGSPMGGSKGSNASNGSGFGPGKLRSAVVAARRGAGSTAQGPCVEERDISTPRTPLFVTEYTWGQGEAEEGGEAGGVRGGVNRDGAGGSTRGGRGGEVLVVAEEWNGSCGNGISVGRAWEGGTQCGTQSAGDASGTRF
jgi:hypothetical protein